MTAMSRSIAPHFMYIALGKIFPQNLFLMVFKHAITGISSTVYSI